MNKARVISLTAVIALLCATGFAQAATQAKPVLDAAVAAKPAAPAAAAVAPAPAAVTKKAMTGKRHRQHHAKKKAAHAS